MIKIKKISSISTKINNYTFSLPLEIEFKSFKSNKFSIHLSNEIYPDIYGEGTDESKAMNSFSDDFEYYYDYIISTDNSKLTDEQIKYKELFSSIKKEVK